MRCLEHKKKGQKRNGRRNKYLEKVTGRTRRKNDQRKKQINLEEDIQNMNTRQRQGNSEMSLQLKYSGLLPRYLVGLCADKLLATFR